MDSRGMAADRGVLFDRDEAERLLDRVRPVAARIAKRRAVQNRLAERLVILRLLHESAPDSPSEFHEFVDTTVRYHRLGGQIDALVEKLAQAGVQVRDRDATHLDFAMLRDDGVAAFCWKLGEPRVTHWHSLHAPHAARRPLDRAAESN